jgi:hypothetical protein
MRRLGRSHENASVPFLFFYNGACEFEDAVAKADCVRRIGARQLIVAANVMMGSIPGADQC